MKKLLLLIIVSALFLSLCFAQKSIPAFVSYELTDRPYDFLSGTAVNMLGDKWNYLFLMAGNSSWREASSIDTGGFDWLDHGESDTPNFEIGFLSKPFKILPKLRKNKSTRIGLQVESAGRGITTGSVVGEDKFNINEVEYVEIELTTAPPTNEVMSNKVMSYTYTKAKGTDYEIDNEFYISVAAAGEISKKMKAGLAFSLDYYVDKDKQNLYYEEITENWTNEVASYTPNKLFVTNDFNGGGIFGPDDIISKANTWILDLSVDFTMGNKLNVVGGLLYENDCTKAPGDVDFTFPASAGTGAFSANPQNFDVKNYYTKTTFTKIDVDETDGYVEDVLEGEVCGQQTAAPYNNAIAVSWANMVNNNNYRPYLLEGGKADGSHTIGIYAEPSYMLSDKVQIEGAAGYNCSMYKNDRRTLKSTKWIRYTDSYTNTAGETAYTEYEYIFTNEISYKQSKWDHDFSIGGQVNLLNYKNFFLSIGANVQRKYELDKRTKYSGHTYEAILQNTNGTVQSNEINIYNLPERTDGELIDTTITTTITVPTYMAFNFKIFKLPVRLHVGSTYERTYETHKYRQTLGENASAAESMTTYEKTVETNGGDYTVTTYGLAEEVEVTGEEEDYKYKYTEYGSADNNLYFRTGLSFFFTENIELDIVGAFETELDALAKTTGPLSTWAKDLAMYAALILRL
ncbi:hypothetical protein ACFL6D_01160 [Spirochaetota bacterium]